MEQQGRAVQWREGKVGKRTMKDGKNCKWADWAMSKTENIKKYTKLS
jgi:hypothetical protein